MCIRLILPDAATGVGVDLVALDLSDLSDPRVLALPILTLALALATRSIPDQVPAALPYEPVASLPPDAL